MHERFRHFAARIAVAMGSPWGFVVSLVAIFVWAACGPVFHFSDTWQLVINTSTTIVTFLMVFLIQNTQNRDARAIHLKLDELIKATKGARNRMMDLDALSDDQLKSLEADYKRICNTHHYHDKARAGHKAVREELEERARE